MKKILLVDGNSLLFRAFYGNYKSEYIMKTSTGIYTNAVFGFISILLNVITENDFYDVHVCFDKGKKTFRHDQYDDYKSGRRETPPELINQFELVREMLSSANIKWCELEGYEADDLIGTIAKIGASKNYEVNILSSDQDMYQLIDEHTFVLAPGGYSQSESLKKYDIKALMDKWGVIPKQVPDFKAIVGDSSDNIKGVKGLGKVGAKDLLDKFKTLENIYANLDSIKEKTRQLLVNDKDSAFLSKEIATIETNANVQVTFTEFNLDVDNLILFFKKYEMFSLAKRLASISGNLKNEFLNEEMFDHQIIENWDTSYEDEVNAIFCETLKDNYHQEEVQVIAISNTKGNFYFKLTQQSDIFNWQTKSFDQKFNIFLSSTKLKIVYDLKKTLTVFKNMGYELNFKSFVYDMMIAAYLINPAIKSNFYDQLVLISNGEAEVRKSDDVFGKGAKRTFAITDDLKQKYYVNHSFYLFKYYESTLKKIVELNMDYLFNHIEMPFCLVLFQMEQAGVTINKVELEKQVNEIKSMLNTLESEIKILANPYIDETFNVASPKQLSKLLFDDLKLFNPNKGSTDQEVLNTLKQAHPIIEKISVYRVYAKLFSTYLEGFKKYIFPDNKVHTIFNQTLTQTGRLSSTEPNLQNISIHDERQKQVRKIFISQTQKSFLAFDYSQIELRILAQLIDEKNMKVIFKNNGDIHSETAKRLFDLSPSDVVTDSQRRTAKAFNFGIIYGLSPYGLSKDLQISFAEAKQMIDKYLETFPAIKKYQTEIVSFAKKNGYVETITKRRRYIAELRSVNKNLVQFGERIAINTPIQGSAADVLKIAMDAIFNQLEQNHLDAQMIAQIHDEIILEVNDNQLNEVSELVIKHMSNALNKLNSIYKFSNEVLVDLVVSQSVGKNWYDLK